MLLAREIEAGPHGAPITRSATLVGPRRLKRAVLLAALCLAALAAAIPPAAAAPATCAKIVLTGQVNAGHEWQQSFGQGWVFRLVPIQPGPTPPPSPYTGWDLVVDRDPPAGFPDALLLATPPYDSINQREIATTFGLRAQDALGWNPRTFRFLLAPADLLKAQKLYFALHSANPATTNPATGPTQSLMQLAARSAAGQFQILDARIAPGTADAAPYAQSWALQSPRTPHTVDASPASGPTPRGALESIRFSVTLWLPKNWSAPKELHPTPTSCQQ
jgi:hypothetical protein